MNYKQRIGSLRAPRTPNTVPAYIEGYCDARFEAAQIGEEVDTEIENLKQALAFWMGVASGNGASLPEDLFRWTVERLKGDKRVAVEVTRLALGMEES